jgi:hypothetical protein
MMQLLVAFLLASVDIAYASDQAGFIFTADKAVNPWNEKESIRILERLPVAELKKRFARYKVDVTAGEDCAICATISRGKVSLSVYYDENGIVVINISSNDNKSTDALGNSIGSSLRSAIGARTADCDEGYWMTCASPRLPGLHYIVGEDKRCPLVTKGKQPTDIPACARIVGFQIVKPP